MKFIIEASNKGYRVEILSAAEAIGDPFTGLTRKVEVKHGGHGIYPQAIDMILFQPENGVADQKLGHFIAAVVEHIGSPIRLRALPRIGMFV